MIEMLVTLGLLSLLVMVSVSWMTTMLRSQSTEETNANWKRASTVLLDRIAEDIHTVDRLSARRQSGVARISVNEVALRIHSRGQEGITIHEYAFDQDSATIRRTDQQMNTSTDQIPMLGKAASFDCLIDLPSDQRSVPVLTISIQGLDGQLISRNYVLDREDVQ